MEKPFNDLHVGIESQLLNSPEHIPDSAAVSAARKDGDTVDGLIALGKALSWQLRYRQAILAYTQALKMDPDNRTVLRLRAGRYLILILKKTLIIQSLPVMLEMALLDKEQIVSHRRSTTFSNVAKTSLRNPRFRISFHICSMGFISGVYGGMWKRMIFSGNSSPPDLCHAAPSQQSKIMSSENRSDNFLRKMFMHTVLQ